MKQKARPIIRITPTEYTLLNVHKKSNVCNGIRFYINIYSGLPVAVWLMCAAHGKARGFGQCRELSISLLRTVHLSRMLVVVVAVVVVVPFSSFFFNISFSIGHIDYEGVVSTIVRHRSLTKQKSEKYVLFSFLMVLKYSVFGA